MASRRIPTILAATLALSIAGNALGADQTVNVGNDKTFSPAAVSILAGETVTWTWVGPDTDHIVESVPPGIFDSDPGVNDITHLLGHTFTHPFANAGTFPYQCRIHGSKMSGTVTVSSPGPSSSEPTASFRAHPETVPQGATVSFDASESSAIPGRHLTAFDWDLDGNGSFETATGGTPAASRIFTAAGLYSVTLRVTDSTGATGQASRTVTVTAPPPPVIIPYVDPGGGIITVPTGIPAPQASAPSPLLLTGVTRQRRADSKGIAVMATCATGCAATATGTIALAGKRIVLTKVSSILPAGLQTRIVLKVPAAVRATLRRALAKGAKPKATVTVTTSEGVASTRTFTLIR